VEKLENKSVILSFSRKLWAGGETFRGLDIGGAEMKNIIQSIILILVLLSAAGCQPAQIVVPPTQQSTAPTWIEKPDFDVFIETSFRDYLMRDPEGLVETGLADEYGVREPALTSVSDDAVRENLQLVSLILDQLYAYDRNALTPEQQLSYDIYEWYLKDLLGAEEFINYSYPVTFMVNSLYQDTLLFFTGTYPINSQEDAQGYIACLSLLDTKLEQLVEDIKNREEAGIVPPRLVVDWTIYDIQSIASSLATATPYYTTLRDRLGNLEGLSESDRQTLLDSAESVIKNEVLPAYQDLVRTLAHLQEIAPQAEGLGQFPNGAAYYNYLLHHETSTTLTGEEIHALGLQELERIHAEMRAVFDELGYPANADLTTLYEQAANESGFSTGEETAQRFRELMVGAEERLAPAFDLQPSAALEVVGGPAGNYYTPGTFDGSRPGVFYALTTGTRPVYDLATTAYHEGIPGHHFQLSIQQETDLPTFRKLGPFNAYIEGWALYAEQLAYEQGWYENDPYGNLGRLQMQALRAARLVVDTGIHAMGWSYDRSLQFMIENTGSQRNSLEVEVARYMAWPAQATSYMVGMLKIMELRQEAKDRLGERFDLVEFHHVILVNGAMPLDILTKVVENFIQAKQNE
jgi:uncharacterized protein (DUF885 family)